MKIISRKISLHNLTFEEFKSKKLITLREIADEAKLLKWKLCERREIFYAAYLVDINELASAKNFNEAKSFYQHPIFRIDYFCK